MKSVAFRLDRIEIESPLRGFSALPGRFDQSFGRYDHAVKPVHHAAALGSADQPDIRAGNFCVDVGNEELLQPECVGHFHLPHLVPRADFSRPITRWAETRRTRNENVSVAHYFLSSCFLIGTCWSSDATIASVA